MRQEWEAVVAEERRARRIRDVVESHRAWRRVQDVADGIRIANNRKPALREMSARVEEEVRRRSR